MQIKTELDHSSDFASSQLHNSDKPQVPPEMPRSTEKFRKSQLQPKDDWIQYQIWEQSGTQTDHSKWPLRNLVDRKVCRNDEEMSHAMNTVETRLAILEEKNFTSNLRIDELNQKVKEMTEKQKTEVTLVGQV